MLSISRFVRLSVCLSVCVFTFEVPFNGLFAPTSRSRMSNIFRIWKSSWKKSRILETRAPADREVSIKDSGFTRPGLGGTVLCLHTATWPGRGHWLAETVWAGSRERFLVLCWNGSNRNREWGLLGRDSPEREQKEVLGLFCIDWAVPGTGIKWEKSHFRWLLKPSITYDIYNLFSYIFYFNKIIFQTV